jgi:hypothetical protein
MPILSEQGISDLQRMVKESVGRDITSDETDTVWYYLLKVLELVWNIKNKRVEQPKSHQAGLFD